MIFKQKQRIKELERKHNELEKIQQEVREGSLEWSGAVYSENVL